MQAVTVTNELSKQTGELAHQLTASIMSQATEQVAMLTDTKSTPTQAPVVNDSTAAPSSAPLESKSLVSADLKTALTLLKDIIGTVDSLPEDHKEVVVSSDKFTTSFLEATSNLLDGANEGGWSDLEETQEIPPDEGFITVSPVTDVSTKTEGPAQPAASQSESSSASIVNTVDAFVKQTAQVFETESSNKSRTVQAPNIVLKSEPIVLPDALHLFEEFSDFTFDIEDSSVLTPSDDAPTAAVTTLANPTATNTDSTTDNSSSSATGSTVPAPTRLPIQPAPTAPPKKQTAFAGHGLKIPASLIRSIVLRHRSTGGTNRLKRSAECNLRKLQLSFAVFDGSNLLRRMESDQETGAKSHFRLMSISLNLCGEQVTSLEEPVQLKFSRAEVNASADMNTEECCKYWNASTCKAGHRRHNCNRRTCSSGSERRTIPCPTCSRKFTRLQYLAQHKCKKSTNGVNMDVRSSNVNSSYCNTNHLTTFSIFASPTGLQFLSAKDLVVLSAISRYLGWVSFSCLAMTVIVVLKFNTFLSNKRIAINTNLCFSLAMAQLVFLVGIENEAKYSVPLQCRLIAALLQYSLLTTFMWMLAEAVHFHCIIVTVYFTPIDQTKVYAAICYGVPLVIVGITAGWRWKQFGTTTACWLSTEYGTNFAFIVPCATIIVVNVVLLSRVWLALKESANFSRRHSRTGRVIQDLEFSSRVRRMLCYVPFIGVTWIAGFFAVDSKSSALHYVFTVLNLSQGVFLFFLNIVTPDSIRRRIRRSVSKKSISGRRSGSLRRASQSSFSLDSSSSGMPMARPPLQQPDLDLIGDEGVDSTVRERRGTNVSYCDLEGNPTSVSFADSSRVVVVSSGGPSERSTPPESSAPCSDDDDDDLLENAGPIPHVPSSLHQIVKRISMASLHVLHDRIQGTFSSTRLHRSYSRASTRDPDEDFAGKPRPPGKVTGKSPQLSEPRGKSTNWTKAGSSNDDGSDTIGAISAGRQRHLTSPAGLPTTSSPIQQQRPATSQHQRASPLAMLARCLTPDANEGTAEEEGESLVHGEFIRVTAADHDCDPPPYHTVAALTVPTACSHTSIPGHGPVTTATTSGIPGHAAVTTATHSGVPGRGVVNTTAHSALSMNDLNYSYASLISPVSFVSGHNGGDTGSDNQLASQ